MKFHCKITFANACIAIFDKKFLDLTLVGEDFILVAKYLAFCL